MLVKWVSEENLSILIIGLGRQLEFHFTKYFKVLTLMSKWNETKTLPTVFAKKIKKGGEVGSRVEYT